MPEAEHRIGSVWARFENMTDIDQLGSEAFHARVRHTSRHLSTLHFLYPGYWIWIIPLGFGVMSVGVTGVPGARRRRCARPRASAPSWTGTARCASCSRDAKAVDFGSLARIAYGTKRFFDPRRIALVGEAATAADPLYSPGSDFIALENDFMTELVGARAGGRERGRARAAHRSSTTASWPSATRR